MAIKLQDVLFWYLEHGRSDLLWANGIWILRRTLPNLQWISGFYAGTQLLRCLSWGRMSVWIKDMDPELTDAQFQLQVLVRLKLHPGRRSDSLAWVTCHASCGSDPRRAHGHLSHGTLAFDMAHGHVGTRFDYVSTSTWVVARFSLEDTVKISQMSSFNTLQILPRIRSRFSSVEHLQTSRACRSTKSTAVCPLFAVRSSVFGFLKG